MNHIVTLAPDAPAEEINACIARDGAVILRDVLSEAELAQIERELGPYWDATPNGSDDFSGQSTTRTGALLARSAKCRKMAIHPSVLGVCDGLLLENCERYQIHVTQAIRIRPGESEQLIHKDKWAWSNVLKDIEPQVNTMWAVTDFTRENGATQVVPGSSNWSNDRRPEPDDIMQAEMTRGSVMIFTGSVLHGGGANRSNDDRIGLLIDYTLGWLRQEENQYLCCPPDIAESFDPLLRRLLGYAMATYTIGYYSPPLPAGSGIEAVSPEYAVDQSVSTEVFGGAELAGAMADDIRS
ncbi:MAG: phytanoyl-CoA dioxygenase family protein [Pseudomonadota bacterium]